MRAALPILIVLTTMAPTPSSAQPDTSRVTVPADQSLPAPEEAAKQRLESSPRHAELVDVPRAGGVPIRTWVAYPERPDPAGVVLVIHEIFGLSDWIRAVGDQLAREGFIAVAPDLISGFGPGGGGTDSVPSRDDVVKLVRALTPEEATARLDAVRAYAAKLPAANGKVATLGFCWGGGLSFAYAASRPAPRAAVVFYGVSPDSATLLRVQAPVLGLYGGDDARVNATIGAARTVLKARGRDFDPHLFAGAGHGFLRQQSLRGGANLAATRKAWPLAVAFLRKHLR